MQAVNSNNGANMKKQSGSTLVVSLIFLTIITIVAVYSLEGSSLQTKMVTNSLFTAITYQECRNEQEANISFYNSAFGVNRVALLDAMRDGLSLNSTETITEDSTRAGGALPSSDLTIAWNYLRDAPSFREGFDLDSEAQSKAHLFEHDCDSTFRFSNNSQTLGAIVDGLQQVGNVK